MKKFKEVLGKAEDFIKTYAGEIFFVVSIGAMLSILISVLMYANTQDSLKESSEVPQAPITLHAIQSIAIFEVLEYEVFEKGLPVKTCFISYSVNGVVTGVNFKNIKEARIFVSYLHTLGNVNYLLDYKLEAYLERD